MQAAELTHTHKKCGREVIFRTRISEAEKWRSNNNYTILEKVSFVLRPFTYYRLLAITTKHKSSEEKLIVMETRRATAGI